MAELDDQLHGGTAARSSTTPTTDNAAATPIAAAAVAPTVATAANGAVAASLAQNALRIRLKTLDERVVEVEAELTMPIARFREKVAHATQVPVYRQRLIYRGKLLKDGTALAAYDIQDGHTIHLVAKPLRAVTGGTSTSSTAPTHRNGDDNADSDASIARAVERNREHLRRLMTSEDALHREDEDAAAATTWHSAAQHQPLLLSATAPPAPTMRRRVPRPGDPTGTAWNMDVLREALGSSNAPQQQQLHGVHELFGDDDAATPSRIASDMGLGTGATTTTTATLTGQQPNVDHIFQGLLTVRTVLSTATTQQPSAVLEASADHDAAILQRYDDDDEDDNAAVAMDTRVRRSRRAFVVGQWLDVQDTVNQWLECTVLAVSSTEVLVHYHGWPSRWDEWIDADSPRLAAFRTRTTHFVNATQLSPAPTTRLVDAPSIGRTTVQGIAVNVRDVLRELLPHVEQLAALCDDETVASDVDDANAAALSEMAHLLAPAFDRLGRALADSAHSLTPLLTPELQRYTDMRRAQQQRTAAAANTRRTGRQPATPRSDIERRDTSLSVRDLVATALPLPPAETPSTRRNIDVHIHAIVAPSSLSSLASLARAASNATLQAASAAAPTAPATTAGGTSRPRVADRAFDEAFGLPSLRQPLGNDNSHALVNDWTQNDDGDDNNDGDDSRMPLLRSFRRSDAQRRSDRAADAAAAAGSTSSAFPRALSARRRRSVNEALDSFLADDFFGTSFEGDHHSHDTVAVTTASGYSAVATRPTPSSIDSTGSTNDTTTSANRDASTAQLGVIPEVAAAEARAREQERSAHPHQTQHPTDSTRVRGNSSASSSSSSSASSATRIRSNSNSSSTSSSSRSYPSFLEFMRRSLRRNFGLSTSTSAQDAADANVQDHVDIAAAAAGDSERTPQDAVTALDDNESDRMDDDSNSDMPGLEPAPFDSSTPSSVSSASSVSSSLSTPSTPSTPSSLASFSVASPSERHIASSTRSASSRMDDGMSEDEMDQVD